MPAMYEALKSKFKQKGVTDAEAKTSAARIFNARRKPGTAPVTNHVENEEDNPNEREPDSDADDKPKARSKRGRHKSAAKDRDSDSDYAY